MKRIHIFLIITAVISTMALTFTGGLLTGLQVQKQDSPSEEHLINDSNRLKKENKQLINEVERLNEEKSQLHADISNKQQKITELEDQLHQYEPDPFKAAIENLDPTVFLKDFENYTPKSDTINISEEQAKAIAQKGFDESKSRIAAEGADDIDSQTIELKEICANNYFTRYGMQSYQNYSHIFRRCYVVTRTNEMRNGITIYVDATTGLIIGGGAFGD